MCSDEVREVNERVCNVVETEECKDVEETECEPTFKEECFTAPSTRCNEVTRRLCETEQRYRILFNWQGDRQIDYAVSISFPF